MDELKIKADALKELMKPFVTMVVKEITPKKDQITISTAYRLYGRKWIDTQRLRGNLNVKGVGKRVMLSRTDIETLLTAENTQLRII